MAACSRTEDTSSGTDHDVDRPSILRSRSAMQVLPPTATTISSKGLNSILTTPTESVDFCSATSFPGPDDVAPTVSLSVLPPTNSSRSSRFFATMLQVATRTNSFYQDDDNDDNDNDDQLWELEVAEELLAAATEEDGDVPTEGRALHPRPAQGCHTGASFLPRRDRRSRTALLQDFESPSSMQEFQQQQQQQQQLLDAPPSPTASVAATPAQDEPKRDSSGFRGNSLGRESVASSASGAWSAFPIGSSMSTLDSLALYGGASNLPPTVSAPFRGKMLFGERGGASNNNNDDDENNQQEDDDVDEEQRKATSSRKLPTLMSLLWRRSGTSTKLTMTSTR